MSSGNTKPSADGATALLHKLYEDKTNTDFTISCKGQIIKVHKVILTQQGGFFGRLVKSKFKESDDNRVELEDYFDVVKAVVQNMYCVQYEVPEPRIASEFHAAVYAAGDYYHSPRLRKLARKNFTNAIRKEDPQTWTQAIPTVYNVPATQSNLRKIIVTYASRNFVAMLPCQGEEVIEPLRPLLLSCPEFLLDVMATRARSLCEHNPAFDEKHEMQFRCHHCNGVWILLPKSAPRWTINPSSSVQCPFCKRRGKFSTKWGPMSDT